MFVLELVHDDTVVMVAGLISPHLALTFREGVDRNYVFYSKVVLEM